VAILAKEKRGVGRPRKFSNKAAQMKFQRVKKKEAGYKEIHACIPGEFKELLDNFCAVTGLTISEMICYLLGCAAEQAVADKY
jgi:hypothetical protein